MSAFDRRNNLLANEPGNFEVRDNIEANGDEPFHAIHWVGAAIVNSIDGIIDSEAKRQGVDPDLIRAIIYVENAQGYYGFFFEAIDVSDTILPMNISRKLWSGLGDSEKTLEDLHTNIRAGITLIRRIQDRVDRPTVATIATLYNSLGKSSVSNFGARVASVYNERPWHSK